MRAGFKGTNINRQFKRHIGQGRGVKFKLTMEDALVYLTNVDPARSTRGMGSL